MLLLFLTTRNRHGNKLKHHHRGIARQLQDKIYHDDLIGQQLRCLLQQRHFCYSLSSLSTSTLSPVSNFFIATLRPSTTIRTISASTLLKPTILPCLTKFILLRQRPNSFIIRCIQSELTKHESGRRCLNTINSPNSINSTTSDIVNNSSSDITAGVPLVVQKEQEQQTQRQKQLTMDDPLWDDLERASRWMKSKRLWDWNYCRAVVEQYDEHLKNLLELLVYNDQQHQQLQQPQPQSQPQQPKIEKLYEPDVIEKLLASNTVIMALKCLIKCRFNNLTDRNTTVTSLSSTVRRWEYSIGKLGQTELTDHLSLRLLTANAKAGNVGRVLSLLQLRTKRSFRPRHREYVFAVTSIEIAQREQAAVAAAQSMSKERVTINSPNQGIKIRRNIFINDHNQHPIDNPTRWLDAILLNMKSRNYPLTIDIVNRMIQCYSSNGPSGKAVHHFYRIIRRPILDTDSTEDDDNTFDELDDSVISNHDQNEKYKHAPKAWFYIPESTIDDIPMEDNHDTNESYSYELHSTNKNKRNSERDDDTDDENDTTLDQNKYGGSDQDDSEYNDNDEENGGEGQDDDDDDYAVAKTSTKENLRNRSNGGRYVHQPVKVVLRYTSLPPPFFKVPSDVKGKLVFRKSNSNGSNSSTYSSNNINPFTSYGRTPSTTNTNDNKNASNERIGQYRLEREMDPDFSITLTAAFAFAESIQQGACGHEPVQFNTGTYNALIKVCINRGSLWRAIHLLDNVMPTAAAAAAAAASSSSRSATIHENNSNNNSDRVRTAKNATTAPNIASYNFVLTGLARVGDIHMAQQYMYKLLSDGLQPNAFTVRAISDGLLNVGDISGAITVIQDFFNQHCVLPPYEQHLKILEMCLALDQIHEAKRHCYFLQQLWHWQPHPKYHSQRTIQRMKRIKKNKRLQKPAIQQLFAYFGASLDETDFL